MADDQITGYIDLPSERAFVYRANAASEQVDMPAAIRETEKSARLAMLEELADFDDDLMAKLVEKKEPERGQVYADLTNEFQAGHIVPVILGRPNGKGECAGCLSCCATKYRHLRWRPGVSVSIPTRASRSHKC